MGVLTDRIYSGLVERRDRQTAERRTRKTAKSLTASIISACKRANWYNFKKFEKDKEHFSDPILLSKFWDGEVEHALLDELFREIGVKVIDSEFGKVCEGIYARVDYLVELENQHYDLEYKTSDEGGFYTFCKHGIVAFPGYYSQCQVILGAKPHRPLILLMKCKGTSEYEDELVERNPEYISNLVQIRKEFDESLLGNTPPDRDYSYNSGECAGCEHKFKCWFSHLRSDILLETDLTRDEELVVDKLFGGMGEVADSYNKYITLETELKDYIAFLHTKHSVSRVRIRGVTSSAVTVEREYPNINYIKSVLTGEELELAFTVSKSKFFRTILT